MNRYQVAGDGHWITDLRCWISDFRSWIAGLIGGL
jgi:hypothetical protein